MYKQREDVDYMSFFEYVVRNYLTNYLGFGEKITSWGEERLMSFGGVVLALGGLFLVVWPGPKKIIKSWAGETVDVKGIILGIVIIIAGGALMAAGVAGVFALSKGFGSDLGLTA